MSFSPFVTGLLMGLLMAAPLASQATPALRGDIIADLQAQEQRLQAGELEAVSERTRRQAERLAGGNAADRWARALYLQLAASAEARAGRPGVAADRLREARESAGVESQHTERWLRQEANLRLAADDVEAGLRLLDAWLSRHAGEPRDHWQMARALADLERWSGATRWVDRAVEASDTLTDAQRALAVAVYQRAGRGAQALALLDAALDAQSPAGEWRRAAGLAQRLGEPGQAAALWEAGWRLGVLDSADDRLSLVKLHLAGGTPARAAEHLARALEEEALPDTLAHRRLLASAWERARHPERALAAWLDVVQRSDAGDDWLRLGQLAVGWGRDEMAERALTEAAARGVEAADSWLAALPEAQDRSRTGGRRQDVTQVP